MLIFAGWNIMLLQPGKSNSLDYTAWKDSLRGDKQRYKSVSLSIGRLFVHHHMKRRLSEYALEYYGEQMEEQNMERFHRIWLEIIPQLEKALKEDLEDKNDENHILYNLGDVLSYLSDILKEIMNPEQES